MIKPILSLIIIVFSVGFGFFYSKPKYDEVQSTRADLQQLVKTSQSANEIKDIIAETGKSLSAVDAEDMARFDVFLPETLDGIRFANNLQHIGVANGLVLSDIRVEQQKGQEAPVSGTQQSGVQPSATGGVTKVLSVNTTLDEGTNANKTGAAAQKRYGVTKASFAFAATYSGFLLFLNDLEKSLGLINITSLSFKELAAGVEEKAVQSDLPPLYQFNIDIETYSLK
jgi:hypothetical protein